ncbi:hypothetical protein [Paractinoplanes ovalisporus]|nr:hypothetical protein [Actinoplanes ovalisporus]
MSTSSPYLLGTPEKARRLLNSIAQADAGLLEEHPLAGPGSSTAA